MKQYIIYIIVFGLMFQTVNAYTIQDNSVYVDNANIKVNITPHTFTRDSGINDGKRKPTKISFKTYSYSGSLNLIIGFNNSEIEPYPKYSYTKKSYNYNDQNTWYISRPFNIVAGQEYETNLSIRIKTVNQITGKYDICFKPSSLTMGEAKTQNKLFCIDPWYNSTGCGRRDNLTTNANVVNNSIPISVNFNGTTYLYRNSSDYQIYLQHCDDDRIHITNDSQILPYINTSAPNSEFYGNDIGSVFGSSWVMVQNFDNGTNASDSTQNGHEGTATGGTGTTVTNNYNNDGVNLTASQYYVFSDNASLDLGTNGGFFFVMLNTNLYDGTTDEILNKDNAEQDGYRLIVANNGGAEHWFQTYSGGGKSEINDPMTVDTIYCLSAGYHGSLNHIHLYHNDTELTTVPENSNVSINGQNFNIGGDDSGNGWQGEIYEMWFTNSGEHTDTEINQICETFYNNVTTIGGTELFEDTTPLLLFVDDPTNTTYTSNSVPINVSATDDQAIDTFWYNFNSTNTTFVPNTTIDNLPNATYNITIYVNNSDGTENNSGIIYFTVSVPPTTTTTTATTVNVNVFNDIQSFLLTLVFFGLIIGGIFKYSKQIPKELYLLGFLAVLVYITSFTTLTAFNDSEIILIIGIIFFIAILLFRM